MTDQTHTDDHARRQIEPGMNRRAQLTGVGAAVALAATVGTTLPASAEPAGGILGELIAAHRTAHALDYAAVDAEEVAEQVFRSMTEGQELWCAVSIGPNGETLSGFTELAMVGEADIVNRIKDTHNSLRATHHSKWSQMMVPDFADQMMEAISAAEARALANVDVVKARREQLRESSGLAKAAAASRTTMEQEQRALARLLAYRPQNDAERDAKLAYLGELKKQAGNCCDDDGTMAFLFEMLNEVV